MYFMFIIFTKSICIFEYSSSVLLIEVFGLLVKEIICRNKLLLDHYKIITKFYEVAGHVYERCFEVICTKQQNTRLQS